MAARRMVVRCMVWVGRLCWRSGGLVVVCLFVCLFRAMGDGDAEEWKAR